MIQTANTSRRMANGMIKPPLQLGTALFLYKLAQIRRFYGKNAPIIVLLDANSETRVILGKSKNFLDVERIFMKILGGWTHLR